jgi:hypothetical protein
MQIALKHKKKISLHIILSVLLHRSETMSLSEEGAQNELCPLSAFFILVSVMKLQRMR